MKQKKKFERVLRFERVEKRELLNANGVLNSDAIALTSNSVPAAALETSPNLTFEMNVTEDAILASESTPVSVYAARADASLPAGSVITCTGSTRTYVITIAENNRCSYGYTQSGQYYSLHKNITYKYSVSGSTGTFSVGFQQKIWNPTGGVTGFYTVIAEGRFKFTFNFSKDVSGTFSETYTPILGGTIASTTGGFTVANKSGSGGDNPVTPPTNTSLPAAPSEIRITNYNQNKKTCKINWTDNSNNETGFTLQFSSDGTNWNTIKNYSRNTASASLKNVNPNSFFRVCAYNNNGSSEWETMQFTFTRPNSPTGATIVNYSPSRKKGTLTWTDNSQMEQGYIVEASKDGGNSWTRISTAKANSTKMSLKNLSPGVSLRVCAYNISGNSNWSTAAEIAAQYPASPASATVINYSPAKRTGTVTWTDNSNNETGFLVKYSNDGGSTWKTVKAKANAASCKLSRITQDSIIRVYAVNEWGESTSYAVVRI